MYSTKDIVSDTKYPEWIRSHPVFNDIESYRKIFTQKGLNDCSVPLSEHLAESALDGFLGQVSLISKDMVERLKASRSDESIVVAAIELFSNFNKEYLNIDKGKKISVLLPEDIDAGSGAAIYKKGMSFFSFIEKLYHCPLDIPNLFLLDSFKKFSRLNIPVGSANIVFSTNPWDIATMSMRGISTCQSWSGEFRKSLIGSILDPYVGIIYLESNGKATTYGSRMLYRAIVRFAIRQNLGIDVREPYLVVDVIYPEKFDEIQKVFIDFLKSKTQLKVFGGSKLLSDNNDFYTPNNKIRNMLRTYSEYDRFDYDIPERDSIASYQDLSFRDGANPVPTISTSIASLKNKLTFKIFSNIPPKLRLPGLHSSKISNYLYNGNIATTDYQIKLSIRAMVNAIVRSDNYDSGAEFLVKKIYFNYINNKNNALKSIAAGEVSRWNGVRRFKKTDALSKNDFIQIMQHITSKADQAVKAELKALILAKPA